MKGKNVEEAFEPFPMKRGRKKKDTGTRKKRDVGSQELLIKNLHTSTQMPQDMVFVMVLQLRIEGS